MKSVLVRGVLLALIPLIAFTINLYAQGNGPGNVEGNFLYVDNGGSVSGFSVAANGALSVIPGSPFPTGAESSGFGNDMEVSPVGNFLYVSLDSNTLSSSISVFSINPGTGALTPVPGSPFTTGTGLRGGLSLAVASDNRFLFAGNTSTGSVAAFRVAANGVLTHVPGSPFPVSNIGISGMAVSSDGKFLSVTIPTSSNHIAMLTIGSDGALTPVPGSPFLVGGDDEITSVEFNCEGSLLFVGDNTSLGSVYVFNVSANGALTPVSGSPFTFNGLGSQAILLNPGTSLLFAVNTHRANVSALNVSPTGSLSLAPGSPLFLDDPNNEDRRPIDVAVNKEGTLLYALSADSAIHVLTIGTNGTLTPVSGSPFFNCCSGYGATIAAYPPKTCPPAKGGPPDPNFDLCIQDSSTGNTLRINSTTGGYQFFNCSSGLTVGGMGQVQRIGCFITFNHFATDRRIIARVNTCSKQGYAAVRIFSALSVVRIVDRDTSNNTCACN
ncbi:MAG TPA: beta-propeller fold lactonase family protein [Blastocatellia bacterium]|nr:beta-propeller fold lactonase family protein [Blastocatellia bacterium]